jgi:hypothetical protein
VLILKKKNWGHFEYTYKDDRGWGGDEIFAKLWGAPLYKLYKALRYYVMQSLGVHLYVVYWWLVQLLLFLEGLTLPWKRILRVRRKMLKARGLLLNKPINSTEQSPS